METLRSVVKKELSAFGIEKLTEIQNVSIPAILKGEETLIIAPTGSGKTESVMVPLLHLLDKKPISCLYVSPLRALNRDLLERLEKSGKTLGFRVETRHGDTNQQERSKQLKNPPDILITTPETLQALLVAPKFKNHLKNVKFVVIDEIHELLEDKRGSQLISALFRLKKTAEFKLYGISATIENPEKLSRFFWEKPPKILKIEEKRKRKIYVEALKTTKEKITRLHELMSKNTILFTNTRSTAELLTSKLSKSININIHHGSLSSEHRKKVEKSFKKGELNKIISTSSLELGIDIGHVKKIIQYGSPRRVSSFTQRLGRSGHRVNETPEGHILTDLAEAPEGAVIAKHCLENKLEPILPIETPLDVLAHQIVGLSLENNSVSIKEAFDFFKKIPVFQKISSLEFYQVLRFMAALGYLRLEGKIYKRTKSAWKYYYENLSTIPDEVKFKLVNAATKKLVANLSESFVENLQVSEEFIVAGTVWTVVNIEDNTIFAIPSGESQEVATWSGELIPVEFEIAQEIPNAIKNPNEYPFTNNTKKLIKNLGAYQKEIRLEKWKDKTVIITWAGNKVNNVIAHVIGAYLSLKYGGVDIKSDQIGIVVRAKIQEIETILKKIDKTKIKKSIVKSIEFSPRFRKTATAVAKRFGAIEKGKTLSKHHLQWWKGTPIEKEAIKEFLHTRMDFENAVKVLNLEINRRENSPFGKYLIEKHYPDFFSSSRPKKQILEALKERLEKTKIKIACLNCKTYLGEYFIKYAPDSCPKCEARFLAVVHDKNKLKNKNTELSGALFLSYGKLALLVQAGKGVGPNAAARILKSSKNELEVLERVYSQEKLYARTKPFW